MITTAKKGMEPELIKIWKECFGDSEQVIDLFFKHRYDPENCLVCLQDHHPVACLFILPCTLKNGDVPVPSGYIYAAATLKKMQGQGMMSSLLLEAKILAASRKMGALLLVPGEQWLFDYYGKRGYQMAFYVSEITLCKTDVMDQQNEHYINLNPTADVCNSIRRRYFENNDGTVSWGIEGMRHAIEEHALFGGGAVAVSREEEQGYALVKQVDEATMFVSELCAPEGLQRAVLTEVFIKFPARQYNVRVPVGYPVLNQTGKPVPFGMMQPFQGFNTPVREQKNLPYLGLPMD